MENPKKHYALSRREFIVAGTALSAALLEGCTSVKDEPREKYPQVPENDVRLPRNGKSVLIVGAGLSGLIAACELLDRGFKVTLLEKNGVSGGRLQSWRDNIFGESSRDLRWAGHPVEHGTHIVLSFYNNFREFLRRHKLTLRPGNINDPASGLAFAYADGTIGEMPISKAPAPWHTMALREGLEKLAGNEPMHIGVRQSLISAAFNPRDPKDVAYLDSISVEDWAKSLGAPESFIKKYMDPLWDMGNFHPSSRTSALYFHRFFGSALGDWKDLYFTQFFRDSTNDSIIEPLKKYIVDNGGEILFRQEVEHFASDGRRITGAHTREIKDEWICPVCGEVHDGPPGRCRRCSFAGDGFKPVFAAGRHHQADYYLLGVDIPNAQKIFAAEPFARHRFFQPTVKLPTSSIVVVYLWYPRVAPQGTVKSNWRDHFGDRECFMTGDFPHLGTTLNLSLVKPESFAEFDADIIETQVARVEWTKGLSNYDIAERIHGDLKTLIPGLPGFADFLVIKWDNFSTMTVGAEANRPPMLTPFTNFLLLGDWIALDQNCFLMEKVTVNAKRAVNHLLDDIGQAAGRLTILPSETPNLLVNTIRKTLSVKV